jgi:hypothetical protein
MPDLRLVEIPSIEPAHIHDIPLALYAFAGGVQDGSIKAVGAIILTIDEGGFVDVAPFGKPMNTAEIIGTLEIAKAEVIGGSLE